MADASGGFSCYTGLTMIGEVYHAATCHCEEPVFGDEAISAWPNGDCAASAAVARKRRSLLAMTELAECTQEVRNV